jgi:hypothetical protein
VAGRGGARTEERWKQCKRVKERIRQGDFLALPAAKPKANPFTKCDPDNPDTLQGAQSVEEHGVPVLSQPNYPLGTGKQRWTVSQEVLPEDFS